MLNTDIIRENLSRRGMNDIKIIYLDECGSTNTLAKEYHKAHQNEKSTVIFIAESQSAGRGRMGRCFHSAKGAGLYISLLIYPDISSEKITNVTPYLAVKLAEATERVSSIRPMIKWVNDLYANGKKLAGILVESGISSSHKPDYLVCGLGINVYKASYPNDISAIATSIEDASGEKISRESLAENLIWNILSDIGEIGSFETFDSYKSRLITVGQNVTVIGQSESYDARVIKLNPDYSLTLTLPDGSEKILFTGEVSVKNKSTCG